MSPDYEPEIGDIVDVYVRGSLVHRDVRIIMVSTDLNTLERRIKVSDGIHDINYEWKITLTPAVELRLITGKKEVP